MRGSVSTQQESRPLASRSTHHRREGSQGCSAQAVHHALADCIRWGDTGRRGCGAYQPFRGHSLQHSSPLPRNLLQAASVDTLLPVRRTAPPCPLYCRLPLLTPSFLCGVLPNLKWVSFTSGGLAPAFFQALQVLPGEVVRMGGSGREWAGEGLGLGERCEGSWFARSRGGLERVAGAGPAACFSLQGFAA